MEPPAVELPPAPPLPAVIGPLFDAGPPAAVPLVTLPELVAVAEPGKPGPWSVAVVGMDDPAFAPPPAPPLPAVIGALLDAGPPAAVPLVTLPELVAVAWPPKNPPG